MGVKSDLSSDLHQIWCEGAFLQSIKGSLLRFTMFWLLAPIWPLEGVKMGVKWGQNRVKYYLGSDLHQIWWEGAFLQAIKEFFIRFLIFWLLAPIWPPGRGQNGGSKWVKIGSNIIWAPIFTKFGGKEHFSKLLRVLSLDFRVFEF